MLLELIADATKLALIVTGLYLVLRTYIRHKQPTWSEQIEKRHIAMLLTLTLVVSTIKIAEDVLGGETGPIDQAILVFIHSHVPDTLTVFFEMVTFTGSWRFLVPLEIIGVLALLIFRHRVEALFLATSVVSAQIVVYVIKTMVGRTRPALWETTEYWGSSFPSGHTLAVTAFSTAIVLCASRISPAARWIALSMALLWISLVAFSRLLLGVHWPTDVLAAACIGAFLPLVISFVFKYHNA